MSESLFLGWVVGMRGEVLEMLDGTYVRLVDEPQPSKYLSRPLWYRVLAQRGDQVVAKAA